MFVDILRFGGCYFKEISISIDRVLEPGFANAVLVSFLSS